MKAKDIYVAAEAYLGESVSWSTVKNALAANVSGPEPRFERVAVGLYRLVIDA